MVLDSSAVIAMLRGEPMDRPLRAALAADPVRLIGAPTVLETSIVLEAVLGDEGRRTLDDFISGLPAEVVPFDGQMVHRARDGWRRFGKGNHPASLNFGDCLTYAVASAMAEPILCIGNDFVQTDAAVVPLG